MSVVYVLDDEKNIRQLIKSFLVKVGYDVFDYENGEEFLCAFYEREPDIIILDIMLPDIDGYTICTMIRETSTVPIIMLSARDSEYDRIAGLKIGGDDYLTKPFSPAEIVERVRTILRRTGNNPNSSTNTNINIAKVKDISIFPDSKKVLIGENKLTLTIKEFDVLYFLTVNKDKAISRDELLSQIWGIECDIDTRVTDDTIKRLRKKLSQSGSDVTIETVWGYGFMINS